MSLESEVMITILFLAEKMQPLQNWNTRLAVQLAAAVWYLASGTDFTTLSQLFGIDKLSVSKCVWEYKHT